ncbi:carbon-nitrogen hydrolase family protein [Anaerocolumna sp.]|uniref:carbon-nitrogen hydrolase family protein n=1 Tax=Anaerocolumna sp. TaxID=2041569 RepID=UPI0028B103BA|nr:carbon-nitrogen hydrolase family protein [Anaerocolumna sp.]
MKISLIQMEVVTFPTDNLVKIKTLLSQAKESGTDVVVLPEMCCCSYENEAFTRYAMSENDLFIVQLAELAKEFNLFLVAGSIPEKVQERIYNTSFVFDPQGRMIARHRKVHLFDVSIENGQYFKESDTFCAGDSATVFDTKWGKIGLMICYDIRFPEFFRLMGENVKLVIIPASFNMTTGPQHWELLFRARALDNQVYMAGCASAANLQSSYRSWGHSIITDPWGDVLGQLDEKEGILTRKLDLQYVDKIRKELPLLCHRRKNLYKFD